MIKVLQIGMSQNKGGIETYIYNLYKCSNKSEFQFDFINTSNEKIAFYDELKKDGIKIHTITLRTQNYVKHIKDLKKVIKNNGYDIIHINLMSYSWFEPIIIANKYSNAKIIIHSHNANIGNAWGVKNTLLHKIGKLLCHNVNAFFVACGDKAGKFMFGKKKFDIFYNGIDLDKFKYCVENRKKIREKFSIKDDTIVIGQVAKLEEQKNPLFLIDVFYEYLKLSGNSKLIIAGDGSLRNKVEEKIKLYQIDKEVVLLGNINECSKLYSSFDIFLMPSLYEGFSISLIEAQVNGLKCYTSDTLDHSSNISKNVEFISLKLEPKYWANCIFNSDNPRKADVLDIIPKEFDNKNSYERVYEYYKKIV